MWTYVLVAAVVLVILAIVLLYLVVRIIWFFLGLVMLMIYGGHGSIVFKRGFPSVRLHPR